MLVGGDMRKYKVLHIITRWLKSGGAERNTAFNIKCLTKERYEIHLALGKDSEIIPADLGAKTLKIKNLQKNVNIFKDIAAFWELYQLVKNGQYDIVHTHQSKAGFLGRLAAKFSGAPIIIHTLHGQLFYEGQNWFVKQLYIFFEKICEKFTDKIICVGEDLRDYYLKHKIGEPEKYEIIRSWIDLEKFREASRLSEEEKREIKESLGLGPTDLVVGAVGRLEQGKGWEEAIKVSQLILEHQSYEVEPRRIKFLFIGKGKDKFLLEKKVADIGCRPAIVFGGYEEHIEKIMAIFDILTSFSRREGLSQVFVQSAAMAMPMVAFDVLGAGETLKENEFIIPPRDIKKMAEKITYLLENPEKAKEIGEKRKNLVDKDWQADEIALKNNQLYEKLLNSIKNDRTKN